MSHASELIASDIEAYLKQHENKDLLRFLTCGSVDDGKSTLIGRLLYDSKLIFDDHLNALHKDNERVGNAGDALDLALLVDGLASEREQGITIDVAYRYFSTDKRKFIIADTPGHEQYTRNMATGASNCDLAILMVDARKGVQTQTRRHSFICSLLGIKHLLVAINKMDLVDYQEDTYNRIREEYQAFAKELGLQDVRFVPISALNGDNVVAPSEHMSWYSGDTLMQTLETVSVSEDKNFEDFRFPVQFVNRPSLDFRGYCGTIAAGEIEVGAPITVLPSGKTSTLKSIVTYEGEHDSAFAGQAVTLTLEDEVDVSRGDYLVKSDNLPKITRNFVADVVWMAETPLSPQKEYLIKFATKRTSTVIREIEYEVDVNTLEKSHAQSLNLNEIGRCAFQLGEAVALDEYNRCKKTGAFVLIDRMSNTTVGAGMVRHIDEGQASANPAALHSARYNAFERDLNALIRQHYPEWQCLPIGEDD